MRFTSFPTLSALILLVGILVPVQAQTASPLVNSVARQLRDPALPALHKTSAVPAPLFRRGAPGAPDTLEIFVLYAEFKREEPDDNPNTTGLGTFNSAFDTNFTLEPSGDRQYRHYLERHLEFAAGYYRQVSGGRLALRWRIFPEPAADGEVKEPYRLSQRLAAYNPENKQADEKNVVFYERKARSLMSFVAEVLHQATLGADTLRNPFLVPRSPLPNVHRAWLIFHAGHSGLIDGGKLGQLGADTPNDIIDFFAMKEDFLLLAGLPADRGAGLAARTDSLGVPVAGGDTVQQVMILSESASQDEVNFGLNGILVNQIARQIGMPDTWDRGTGFTKLGYFDLMDVGHLAGNGFLPVLPSAWVRYYLGWEDPLTASPGPDGVAIFSLGMPGAAGPGAVTAVKVPLGEREYLLIENRQRSGTDTVTVRFQHRASRTDRTYSADSSVRVPAAFLDSLLLDSLCDRRGKNCRENPWRPKGIITGASSYDLGLPGSGLVVWHVNEWFIEPWIRYGIVNITDAATRELSGLSLVEADGELSIGKEGRDQLGQSVFDFGSASDVLPHVRKRLLSAAGDSSWDTDTVRFITPYTHAGTNSWNDGRSHVTLEALLPSIPAGRVARSQNTVFGDSVFTFPDTLVTLRVRWGSAAAVSRPGNWRWPVRSPPASAPMSFSVLRHPDTAFVASVSDGGWRQVYGASGAAALPPFDTLLLTGMHAGEVTFIPSERLDDTVPIPRPSLGDSVGPPLGTAVLADSVLCVLAADGRLHLSFLRRDSLAAGSNAAAFRDTALDAGGLIGPLVIDSLVWVVATGSRLRSFGAGGVPGPEIALPLPARHYHSFAGLARSGGGFDIALVADNGRVVIASLATGSADTLPSAAISTMPESFSISTADFDRNDTCDILVLGSRTYAALIRRDGSFFPNFPLRVERALPFITSTDTLFTEDPAPPAIADLNQDGYPEFLFTGNNALWALDRQGASLPGWPFVPERRQDIGLLYSNATRPASVIGSTPLVIELGGAPVALLATPDGLVWAAGANGRPLGSSSFDPASLEARQAGVIAADLRDWPLAAGGLTFDTTLSPYLTLLAASLDSGPDLALLARSGTGEISAWMMAGAKRSAAAGWIAPGGDLARRSYFNADALPAPVVAAERSVIREFHLYPSPLEGAVAWLHLETGAPTRRGSVRFFDIAGNEAASFSLPAFSAAGLQPKIPLDLARLGPDVYTALLEITFANGTRAKKFTRLGVIR